MRDVDVELARKLRARGPFHLSLKLCEKAEQCDLCGGRYTRMILGVRSLSKNAWVRVCLVNKCAEHLFGADAARQLKYHAAADQFTFKIDSSGHPTDVGNFFASVPSVEDADQQAVARQAQANAHNGLGSGWKIVPSILKQFERGKPLSPRQLSVLKRYNHACEHEALK